MTKEKWYTHGTTTGWDKDNKASTRRKKLLESTDKRKTMHNRYLEAARRIQALANVNQDPETQRKAKADANYFFKMTRKTKK